ncbi:peptidase S1 [Maricaulis maris]|uniref:Peptidase S1 n=1 Tax=Maricaulis maris TaxID=74318 RepID=A0A495D2G7_9PROT|nr:peptidase S1 [Maricaulis maris]RKQ95120.1 hypothetical protein C7435_2807 [Maricaulis maris]
MKRLAIIAGLACLIINGSTSAQTFGSVNLRAGFTPDPYRTTITSGGNIAARNLFTNCTGWVADAVDFAVYYSAGNYNLTISATSQADTTLIVQAPNGQFYCDDDSGPGLNPTITIGNPGSGAYSVWVGSYRQGEYAQATLSVSEIGQR